ncbi:MAG: zinc-binding dehydrogenase [Candidatus Thorarchaeota archaeon]
MISYAEMDSKGNISVKTREPPILENGAIVLETIYSELCGTDVHLRHNKLLGVPYPIIPGHVSIGKVIEKQGKVKDIQGNLIEEGTIATFLDVHETCNHCYYCLVAKASTRCPKRKVYGITYSSADGLLGGWSEKIYLKPGVKILPLPRNFDPRTYIAGGCALPTAIHAIERANIPLGATVLVQGSGPVGLMVALLAKIKGAYEVIMTGAPDFRLEIAKSFGVNTTIDITKLPLSDRLQIISELTDKQGPDITIEASGNPLAVSEGLKITREAGTMVVVGQYTDNGEIQFNPHSDLNKKHLNLLGSWGSDFSHFYLAIKTLIKYEKDYPWQSIISKEYGLNNLNQALNELETLQIMKGIVNPHMKNN